MCSLPAPAVALRVGSPRQRRALLVGALLVVVGIAVWPRYPVATVAADEVEARHVGRPLREQLAAAIDRGLVDDDVEVDLSRLLRQRPPVRDARQVAAPGIEFHFVPDSRNLDRFGDSRCVEAGRYERLLLISGPTPSWRPDPSSSPRLPASPRTRSPTTTPCDSASANCSATARSRSTRQPLDDLATTATDELRTVLTTPGLPAAGLARHLDSWRRAGYVDIPAAEREQFDRWFELEQRSSADYQTIVVEQPSAPDQVRC